MCLLAALRAFSDLLRGRNYTEEIEHGYSERLK